MSNNLLKQLEEKINAAVETIELSRIEITDLKEQNDELQNRYVDWEERLSALIEKFEQLEEGEAVEIETETKATINKVEEESQEVEAEEDEGEDVILEPENTTVVNGVNGHSKISTPADDEGEGEACTI